MRDDVNYRQRAETVRELLMNSLSVSEFAKNRSEYNWINTQKQLLSKGELPKDRKQFLDKFLPKWDYDTEVLLDSMHALKVKELYNKGYTDLKLFSELHDIKDTYLLAYCGIFDIKTLMRIPTNIMLVKNINDTFLSNLQHRLKEGVLKPTKRAYRLAQAISKTQYAVLKWYEPSLTYEHLSKFWMFENVEYTHDLTPRKLAYFNFCSPSYYDEGRQELKMVYNPKEINGTVIPKWPDGDILGCEIILRNLPRSWNNASQLNELLCHKQYDAFFAHLLQARHSYDLGRKPKKGLWDPNGFVAPPAEEFATVGDECADPGGEFN